MNRAQAVFMRMGLLGILLPGLFGCGELTSGGIGEVEVVLAADSIAMMGLLREAGIAADAAGGTIEGTLTARVRSYIGGDVRGEWRELTDGPEEITLPLEGGEIRVLARRELAPGSYVGVRTIFGRVEANVVRGLTVDGEPIIGTVQVNLGPDGLIEVLDPNLLVEVGTDRTTEVAIEMHSRIWLRLLDRATRRVDPQDFRGVVRVRVRSR